MSWINDVSGLLVNETCDILQDIVERLISTDSCRECTKSISVAKNIMKNHLKDQIIMDNNCCFYGLKYALSHDMAQRDGPKNNGYKLSFFSMTKFEETFMQQYHCGRKQRKWQSWHKW